MGHFSQYNRLTVATMNKRETVPSEEVENRGGIESDIYAGKGRSLTVNVLGGFRLDSSGRRQEGDK